MKDNLQRESEFRASADRHDVDHSDIMHAFRNAVFAWDLDDSLQMRVGPGSSGQLLEVGFIWRRGIVVVIHAMPARTKFLRRM